MSLEIPAVATSATYPATEGIDQRHYKLHLIAAHVLRAEVRLAAIAIKTMVAIFLAILHVAPSSDSSALHTAPEPAMRQHSTSVTDEPRVLALFQLLGLGYHAFVSIVTAVSIQRR